MREPATTNCFTDAAGHLILRGEHEPFLVAVGYAHEPGCSATPGGSVTPVELGRHSCSCAGEPILAWADPMTYRPTSLAESYGPTLVHGDCPEGLVIDCSEDPS